jgi:integrase
MLDKIENLCLQHYHASLVNGIPDPQYLKDRLDEFVKPNRRSEHSLYMLIDQFENNQILHQGKKKEPNTLKKYKSTRIHLENFEKKTGYRVDFDTINMEFYYKFNSYLRDTLKLKQNSIAKYLQATVAFMNKGVELGYTTNTAFRTRGFAIKWEETDAVYLSDGEIEALYRYDLSKDKRLEQTRDLFVFGCCTGLRHQDYSDVKPENIFTHTDGRKYIRMITKKTRQTVTIPCHPLILEIFLKYDHRPNKLPRAISNQKFNEYIKDACKEAGLKEKGRLLSDPAKELWECVSSHTARRSFATNLYLDGVDPIEIRKITTHKSEKTFLKYIKVTHMQAAERLGERMHQKWGERKQKVGQSDQ